MRDRGACPTARQRLDGAAGDPPLELAQPVELEARRTDDNGRVGPICLERRDRLDCLSESLLVAQERAALREHVGDTGTLERLQLAPEPGHRQGRVGGGRQTH
jgi:hypothetical protein